MKNFTLVILFLTAATASAQLHIINDAFLYSKGTDIVVTGDLTLDKAPTLTGASGEERPEGGSAFYLRNEAQLIQLDPAATNTGEGTFSVFQEGVADNFTYNYWSAPVSSTDPTLTAGGFKNNQLFFPILMEDFPFETDFVIDAQRAVLLENSVRDGITDDQSADNDGSNPVVNDPLRIASRWLYSYNSVGDGDGGGGGYIGWTAFKETDAVVLPGYGFTMKGVMGAGPNIEDSELGDGQRYDFRGIPNTGNYDVGVATGDFSLIGNPYPSALDLKRFLVDTENRGKIDAAIYFWDSQPTSHNLVDYEGGYGTYLPGDPDDLSDNGMYVNAPFIRYTNDGEPIDGSVGRDNGAAPPVGSEASRRYAPIGQGFVIQRSIEDDPKTEDIVEGDFAPGDGPARVTFKNTHRAFIRENDKSSLFKSAGGNDNDDATTFVRPKIRLNAFVNDSFNREMILAFGETATAGWDWGLDGSNIASQSDTDVFMPIEGRQAIIQTINAPGDEVAVPLTLKAATPATFKFAVNLLENLELANIFIHDKETNTNHDILNSSYTIETGEGVTENRYEIVFVEKNTLSNDDVTATNGFNIFQNNDRRLLTVLNPNMKDVSNISVYDLAGRQVIASTPDVAVDKYTFDTSNYSTGIYIVRVTTSDDQELATKVSISK
jgi:hypothetical protein